MCATAVLQIQARHKDGAQLWKTSRLPSKRKPSSHWTGYYTVSSALKISMKSDCLSSHFRWVWRWSKPGSWWDWTWIQWCVWRLGMRRSTPRWKNQPTVRITTRSASTICSRAVLLLTMWKMSSSSSSLLSSFPLFSTLCSTSTFLQMLCSTKSWSCPWVVLLSLVTSECAEKHSNSVLKILWPLLLPQLRGDFCAPCFTNFI